MLSFLRRWALTWPTASKGLNSEPRLLALTSINIMHAFLRAMMSISPKRDLQFLSTITYPFRISSLETAASASFPMRI